MVAIVGQRMEMECQGDSNSTISEWSVQKTHTSNKEIIFTNWKDRRKINKAHFGIVEGTNVSVVLYTNSTEMDDAGIYTCAVQKELRQPDRLSAQLIVFEAEPLCETNLSYSENDTLEEGTHFWMRCTVSFAGNWVPTMEWRLHDRSGATYGNPRELIDWVNVENATNASISSTLAISLKSTSNLSYFSFRIYFTPENRNQSRQLVTATNTPEYNYIWNSPMLRTSEKLVLQPSTQLIGLHSATEDSPKNVKDLSPTLTAIYLVAGVAILFGITGSMAAIILCLRLRRKNSATIAQNNSKKVEASDYDLIPYAITDGYDSIEEIDEKDDTMFINFPPRHGPLPEPGYAPLMPDEPKPPGVYSRMDHKENSVKDGDIDVDEMNLPSGIPKFKHDHSKIPDAKLRTMDTIRANSYLALTTEMVENSTTTGDEIPSAYLKITDELQLNTENIGVKSKQIDDPNSYLELVTGLMPHEPKPLAGVHPRLDHNVEDQESDVDRNNPQPDIDVSKSDPSKQSDVEKSTMKMTSSVNSYLVLEPEINIFEAITSEGEESSSYLTIRQDSLKSNVVNNVQGATHEYEFPSSYLTTREIHSSAVQKITSTE